MDKMKRYQIVIIAFLLLMQFNAFAQPCLNGWKYRSELSIANSNNDTLLAHQVKYVVNTQDLVIASKAEIDGSDLRLTNAGGAQLPFWFDPITFNTTSTEIWIKVDSIFPAPILTNLYLFYGNSGVSPAYNANNTFEFFDDFSGATLNAAKWDSCGNVTVAAGKALISATAVRNGSIETVATFANKVTTEINVAAAIEGIAFMGQRAPTGRGWNMAYENSAGSASMRLMSSNTPGSSCIDLTNQVPSANSVPTGSVTGIWSFSWFDSDSIIFKWPSALEVFREDNMLSSLYPVDKHFQIGTVFNAAAMDGSISVDWARIRKYAEYEPAVSMINEQAQIDSISATNSGPYCQGETIMLAATEFTGGNYNWQSSGFSSTSKDTIRDNALPSMSGWYYVVASTPGGCGLFLDSTYVEVSPQSNGGTLTGSATVCSGANSGALLLTGEVGEVVYWETATSLGGPWSTISTTDDSLYYENVSMTTYFRTIVKSGTCALDTSTIGVITTNQPTIGGNVLGSMLVCEGDNTGQLELDDSFGTVNFWEYSEDNGMTWDTVANSTTIELYNDLLVPRWYRVEVESGVCDSVYSDTAIIGIHPKPVVSFVADSVCEGLPTTFTESSTVSTGIIQDYLWDFDNGSGSVNDDPIFSYSADGVYGVLLRVTTEEGCVDSVRNDVIVYPAPSVNFSQNDVCDSVAMIFTNLTAASGLVDYIWDFGDGTGSYTPFDTAYVYPYDSTFTVTLLATTEKGCIDSISKIVNVYPRAAVDFIADSVCQGESITFINTTQTTSSSIDYVWTFGDGGVSANLNPAYTYTASGTYTVTLQSNVPGGCVNSNNHIVEIYPAPFASFTFSDECLYDSVEFTNGSSLSSGTLTNSWDLGDGSTSNLPDVNHKYAFPGSYTVQLLLTSDYGCSSSFSSAVDVFPIPIADFSVLDVCDEVNVSLVNASSIAPGTMTYAWDFGDFNVSTDPNPNHLYNTYGQYTIELISESDKGCLDTIQKTVNIHPLPQPNFTFDIACDGAPTNFYNGSNISGGGTITSYLWDMNGAGSYSSVPLTSNTSQNPIFQYLNSGTYSVILSADSDEGCTKDTTIDVQVSSFPLADFSAESECIGTTTAFVNNSNISVGTLTYSWDFGDDSTSTSQDPTHMYLAPGAYPVQVVATSGLGCADSVIKLVTVYDLPVVTAGADTSVSQGFSVMLEGSAIGASAFNWSPIEGLDNNTVFNPSASPLVTTTYALTVTDLNGCVNYDSVMVTVIEDFRLFIYNIITPDGNGQNDTWTIANIETFSSADIAIFDRWGSEVFAVKGYQSDWGGVNGTDQLPDGTYYYTIKFDTSDKLYSGAISVLRNK